MRLALIILLAACTASSGGTPGADTIGVAAAREAVMQADRDFADAFRSRRVEGWVSWFDTAGVQVEPRGTMPRGHDAIRAHMTATSGDTAMVLAWRPTEAHVSNDGSMAYTIGDYDYYVRGRDSARTASSGQYLTVWRRQADSSWKVMADIGSPRQRPQ
ncbi:MAG: YybH family protein [Gemmatimonadaceae bacterium]